MPAIPQCKTMRELARYLGLDQSTVSLALRNDPRLLPETRERVKQAAAEMGYQPDPKLSSLMHYLRARSTNPEREVIAFVLHVSQEYKLTPPSGFSLQFSGIKQRVGELGFVVEKFVVGPGHYTFNRLNKVLIARGIAAVIIGPMPSRQEQVLAEGLDWNRIAAVAFNFRFSHDRLNRVASDHAAGMILALDKLSAEGYRRIGFVLGQTQDVATRGLWRLVYRGWVREHADKDLLLSVKDDSENVDEIVDWFEKERPDAIVGLCDGAVKALGKRDWACPRDFAFVRLDWYENLPMKCAGINQFHLHAGVSAVDLVAQCLRRHELGLFANPQLQFIKPAWADGPTVVPKRRRTARRKENPRSSNE